MSNDDAGHAECNPEAWAAAAHVARDIRTERDELAAESTRLRAEVQRLGTENAEMKTQLEEGELSDGYHTHAELYEYRMLYNAHAALGWLAAGHTVVRSWHHHDGQLCFGGGWFIVVAELPTGQVSNHYAAEHWDAFDGVPEVAAPPAYDGHTPSDAAVRLRDALAIPGETPRPQPAGRFQYRVMFAGTDGKPFPGPAHEAPGDAVEVAGFELWLTEPGSERTLFDHTGAVSDPFEADAIRADVLDTALNDDIGGDDVR